jgi:hypothetical protein
MRIKYQGGSNSQGHGAQKKAVWAEAQENGRQNQAEWIAQRSEVEGGAGCWVLGAGERCFSGSACHVVVCRVVSCRGSGRIRSDTQESACEKYLGRRPRFI